ncbi:MAG: indolepyruvate oxidoreductase subunit beta family protein, partial [Chloroflexi bacterium]|nr:indolepyruvate oxidoreductase subunit beta family protein [Chloroflexota bacterium]
MDKSTVDDCFGGFMSGERPLTILLSALGGQGGGVLTYWLVEAAHLAGYPAQATSIPGVAQRTGATTYYFELFPLKNPPADPIFCLFPSAGDVDLIASLEPAEAGRALQQGYVTSETTVISSTKRVYSVSEKSVAGDGTVDVQPLLEAMTNTSKRLIQIQPEVASGRQLNAAMFGAIIGSGVLPLTAVEGRAAIESRGLAVEANLAGFEVGLELVARKGTQSADVLFHPTTDKYGDSQRKSGERFELPPDSFGRDLEGVPEGIRPLIGHAITQLVDYQNEAYARQYLERMAPVLAADSANENYRLAAAVAKRLAAWMSYEDVVRVAQLKTRPGRLTEIREDLGAAAHEPVAVQDFLSPGRDELTGVLPSWMTRLLPKSNGKNEQYGSSFHVTWPTSTPWGYGGLKFLAALRRIRPFTEMFTREQEGIDGWLTAVNQTIPHNYQLATQVAELAILARGYGDIRARGLAQLATLFTNWQQQLTTNGEAAAAEVNKLL